LSFLGLGVPPPALSWGRLLREGYSYLMLAPWISVASGAAIFVVVLAFQLLADGLQEALARRAGSVRLRGTRGRGESGRSGCSRAPPRHRVSWVSLSGVRQAQPPTPAPESARRLAGRVGWPVAAVADQLGLDTRRRDELPSPELWSMWSGVNGIALADRQQ